MQPARRRADQLGETALDRHVDVLELDLLGHAVALIFGRDPVEPFEDRRCVRSPR